jgi:polyisoprenyl-teichoic acid--peptidoglycan teichoic acid transferase
MPEGGDSPRSAPAPSGGRAHRAVRSRPSAFAAAFLSLLLPGLGHAYLGYGVRALAWAALPVLALAAIAGIVLSAPDRTAFAVGLVTDETAFRVVLGLIVLDLLYRLAAVLDAYRLGRDRRVGTRTTSRLSTAGLIGVVLVLVASHVAVAQTVARGQDAVVRFTENAGDESAVPRLDDLGEAFDFLRASPPATAGEPAPSDEPAAVPSPSTGPGWEGERRLDILLIGTDGGRQGEGDDSYLTDSMIVVSIDPGSGRIAFISLPRDTIRAPLPSAWPAHRHYGGSFPGKINTLYTAARLDSALFPGNDRERGYRALTGVLSELYGLRIDHYVTVDLDSFRALVRELGGVLVDVQLPVYDPAYPTSDGRGNLNLYMPPGMQRMNGQDALAYVRSRHGSTDFDRAARQQRLFSSLRDQTDLASLFAPGALDRLVDIVTGHVRTNIPPRMIPRLVSLAQEVDLERRVSLVLSPPKYGRECFACEEANGQYVVIPDIRRIRAAAQDVLAGNARADRTRQRIEAEGAVVHVLNGTGGANTKATDIAAALGARGIDAIVPPLVDGRADRDDYAATVIRLVGDAQTAFPETLERLTRTFDDAAVVEGAAGDAGAADIVVIVGTGTKALRTPR